MSLIRRATRLCSLSFQAWHDALSKSFLRLGLASAREHSYQPVGFAWLVRCLQGLGLASFVGQQGWVPRRLQMFTLTQTERLQFYLGLELASHASSVLYVTLCWIGFGSGLELASQASSVLYLKLCWIGFGIGLELASKARSGLNLTLSSVLSWVGIGLPRKFSVISYVLLDCIWTWVGIGFPSKFSAFLINVLSKRVV